MLARSGYRSSAAAWWLAGAPRSAMTESLPTHTAGLLGSAVVTLLETVRRAVATAPPVPELPPEVSRRRGVIGQWVGNTALSLAGWKVSGNFPDIPKLVIIVAPHTSNWDFIIGFATYLALDLYANWFGKHTIFIWPFGVVLRRFGGIPIRRQSREVGQVVDVYADAFQSRDRLLLAIAPEGTRKKVVEWKSGFYRIAVRAEVPIVPVGLDYRLSRVIIGEPFFPTGDWERDVGIIKSLYEGVTPKHPHQY